MDISEKTKVPLFAVLASSPFIIGAILWMTSIDAKASAAKEIYPMVQNILERVIRIEENLKNQK